MRISGFRHYALSSCVAVAMLAGCGALRQPFDFAQGDKAGDYLQPPIAAPGAMPQAGSVSAAALSERDDATFQILYTFLSRRARQSGWGAGPPIAVNDRFLGTTSWGGETNNGVVYTIDTSGKHERAIYSFRGSPDGALAGAALLPLNGALYGTTVRGGLYGIGTVFSVTTSGEEHVLHSFQGSDGYGPDSRLVLLGGKLYGTTEYGGNRSSAGVVFEITKDGQERTIHIFGTRDQDYATFPCCLLPFKGKLYGVTSSGGNGSGVIFDVAPSGQYRNVHVFTAKDGGGPTTGLVELNGTLYGVTHGGYDNHDVFQHAAFYALQPPDRFHIIARMGNRTGGAPGGALTAENGKFYGVSSGGGGYRGGDAMEIDTSGRLRVIYAFHHSGGSDPSWLLDYKGALFGEMRWGSPKNGGTMYRLMISP
jgi:uncharacterized repeat protein (TIGR03803 family)